MELRARKLHETGSLVVLTNCSNAFNAVRRAKGAKRGRKLRAIAHAVSGQFFWHRRPADVCFRMDLGKTRTTAYSNGVQQGDRMGLVMFCLAM